MAHFDDLLRSSRNELEENPFGDPFAPKRSSSPDPWANPYAEPQDEDPIAYGTGLEHESIEQPPLTPEPALDVSASDGPLDLASIEVEEPPLSTSTSGFREFSVPSNAESEALAKFDAAETGGTTAETPTLPSAPALPLSHTTSIPTTPSTPPRGLSWETQTIQEPGSPATASSASWQPHAEPTFISPLDGRQAPLASQSNGFSNFGDDSEGWNASGNNSINEREPSASSTAAWHSRQSTEEDDDDDRPLQAIVDKSRADAEAKQSLSASSSSGEKVDSPFRITVDDPQKVGDPIRGYTMYTVHTNTTSTLYRTGSFSVLRRYSDFLWLYETLSLNNPGVVVPPVPEKSPFGRFEGTFVEQRRMALEKCINKIANHPVLMKDVDLKMFLESDSFALDVKQRKAEIANERGGLMASIGQTIAGSRFYETDEWFDQKRSYLDSLEVQLKGLVKAIDTVAKQRAELALVIAEFGQTMSDIAQSDVGKVLARALSGLADVERKAQDIQDRQSRQDVMTIMSTADEYARLIISVRMAFNSRVRTYHSWQSADAEVRRVKQLHERNRAQGRIQADRMGYSMNQIAEAERRAMESKTEFEQCSRLIKSEVARFEQERISDFKTSLQRFLDGMIDGQKELIAAWESYQQTLLKGVNKQGQIQQDVPVETNGNGNHD